MRAITIPLLLILASCNSKKDDNSRIIQKSIDNHNSIVRSNFETDSIEEVFRYKRQFIFIPKDSLEKKASLHGKVFKHTWNSPYDIKKDYNLTFNKYLDYCKAHNLDPKTFYKFME